MKKNVKKNYLYNVTYQILTLLTPLITTPYVSRVLGADGIGVYSFTLSIATYFITVAAMGTAAYGQREISYVQDKKDKYSIVFWNTELFSCISTFICALLFFAYIMLQKENRMIYLALSLNVIAVAFDITWFFQGLEEFKIVVIRNAFFKIANILFILIFIKSKNDLLLYTFGMSLFTLLSAISMWGYLPKYLSKVDIHLLKPYSVFKGAFILFLPAIATTLYAVIDKTMIGVITSSSFENGYYEQASKIAKLALTIISSLSTVMMPRIGYYFKNGNKEELNDYMYKSYRLTWFISLPLCFGLIAISQNFVPWFFGDGYDKVVNLLCILSFLIPVIGSSTITGSQYMVPTKQQKKFNISIFIGLCVNFILNALLIPHFLSEGAAIASVIAELSITLIQFYYIRKQLDVVKIFKSMINYFIASLIMFCTLFFIGNALQSSVINTVLLIIIGILIYLIILLTLRDKMMSYIIDIVKNKLIR